MARPQHDIIETFMSITGASEAVAFQKLEVRPQSLPSLQLLWALVFSFDLLFSPWICLVSALLLSHWLVFLFIYSALSSINCNLESELSLLNSRYANINREIEGFGGEGLCRE